ncbi:hypothetical protein AJ80_01607 [Polytolypa hystricis UAMH7299]|uniref:Myb-like domain-containing protein n=1 Tax=Polytolypa hystricis (strain UAMH7299) TaxID=1447883 RepID=A0A2B7Z019_POLH7|nr:hypothetical protein AJ80_01607 [Polytolypa hystricis UAMH7299]
MMEAILGTLTAPTAVDDLLSQSRDLPQLNDLRIPPLRDPIPPRALKAPSPLEPNAGGVRESNIPKTSLIGPNPPAKLPTLADFLNAARTNSITRSSSGKLANPEPPPKTILPAFINLRAVELPYASFDEEVPRKRRRLDAPLDTFGEHLQLPIPKTQTGPVRPRPFGPLTILNGLNEPPPNAALFPPIEPNAVPTILTRATRDIPETVGQGSSGSSEERRGRRIDEIIDPSVEETVISSSEDTEDGQPASNEEIQEKRDPKEDVDRSSTSGAKPTEKTRKRLRKWTEEETKDLLRGVVKCGVGNWTAILAQPELRFNNRTAANLKDRFRVCCPWVYSSDHKTSAEAVQTSLAEAVNGSESSLSGKIVLPDPRLVKSGVEPSPSSNFTTKVKPNTSSNTTNQESTSSTTPERPTTNPGHSSAKFTSGKKRLATLKAGESLSSKSKSTLVELGLPEPCDSIKSKRRFRRPFTPAEDEALLKGYAVHGFQWTLIREDQHLNLMHRKATDLRDRFRTKFPNAYREGGSATAKNMDTSNSKENNNSSSNSTTNPSSTKSSHRRTTSSSSIAPLLDQTPPKPSLSDASRIEILNSTDPKKPTSRAPPNEVPPAAGISSSAAMAPMNPIMLAPPPPQPPPLPLSLGLPDISNVVNPSFQVDESGGAGVAEGGGGGDVRWADNTLPPLVWDEFS